MHIISNDKLSDKPTQHWSLAPACHLSCVTSMTAPACHLSCIIFMPKAYLLILPGS